MPFAIDDIRVETLRYLRAKPLSRKPYLQGLLSGTGVQAGLMERRGDHVYDLRLLDFLKKNVRRKLVVVVAEFNNLKKLKHPIALSDFVGETEAFREEEVAFYFEGFEIGLDFASLVYGALSHPEFKKEEVIVLSLGLIEDTKKWLFDQWIASSP